MGIIRIVQREKVNKDGTSPLYVTFNLNREKIRIPTKLSVFPSEWDVINERIIGRGKDVKDKNLILSDLIARVSDIFVRYRLRRVSLNKEAFMREFNNPSDYQDFHQFVKAHLKKLSKELELGTYKHHKSVMKKLEEFCPGLQFQEITPDFLHKYLLYLKRKLGNMDSTAYRNISTIKIIRWIYEQGFRKTTQFLFCFLPCKLIIPCLKIDSVFRFYSLEDNSGQTVHLLDELKKR